MGPGRGDSLTPTAHRLLEDMFDWEVGSVERFLYDDSAPEPGPAPEEPVEGAHAAGGGEEQPDTLVVRYLGELSRADAAHIEALTRRLAAGRWG